MFSHSDLGVICRSAFLERVWDQGWPTGHLLGNALRINQRGKGKNQNQEVWANATVQPSPGCSWLTGSSEVVMAPESCLKWEIGGGGGWWGGLYAFKPISHWMKAAPRRKLWCWARWLPAKGKSRRGVTAEGHQLWTLPAAGKISSSVLKRDLGNASA